jgi:hypothetical protein
MCTSALDRSRGRCVRAVAPVFVCQTLGRFASTFFPGKSTSRVYGAVATEPEIWDPEGGIFLSPCGIPSSRNSQCSLLISPNGRCGGTWYGEGRQRLHYGLMWVSCAERRTSVEMWLARHVNRLIKKSLTKRCSLT